LGSEKAFLLAGVAPRIADKGAECNPSASQTPVSPKEWVSWA